MHIEWRADTTQTGTYAHMTILIADRDDGAVTPPGCPAKGKLVPIAGRTLECCSDCWSAFKDLTSS